jgi:hypothetical protein
MEVLAEDMAGGGDKRHDGREWGELYSHCAVFCGAVWELQYLQAFGK